MKIGILTQYFPPEMGAPQKRLFELATKLIEAGHEVIVLTAMPNYPLGKVYEGYPRFFMREQVAKVPVIRTFVCPAKSSKGVPRIINYFSFVISSFLAGILKLPRLDYLMTESPPLFLGLSGYLLSRAKKAKWIFNVSDLWPQSVFELGVIAKDWKWELASRLESFCYRKAWAVTGQSREIIEDIQSRFPQIRTCHLSNGVDVKKYSPSLRSGKIRSRLGEGEDKCVAIYAGLHGMAQGLEQVLEAAFRLKENKKLHIIFVGEGPEKETLRQKANKRGLRNLTFLPGCSQEEMPEILSSADIAIIPLKTKLKGAVPSKLYEAMASGLPVVLVADGESAGIVKEAQCGFAVSPGNIQALADALACLAEDIPQRKTMGKAGRTAVFEKYDFSQIASKFIDYLETSK